MAASSWIGLGLAIGLSGCAAAGGGGDDSDGEAVPEGLPAHFEGQLQTMLEADAVDGLGVVYTAWTIGVSFDRVGDSGHYELTVTVPAAGLSEYVNSDPSTTLQACETEVTRWGDFTGGLDIVGASGATTWTAHAEGTAVGTVSCDVEGPIVQGEVSLTPAIDLTALPCGLDGGAIPLAPAGAMIRGDFDATGSCVDGDDNLQITASATILGSL